MPHYKVRPEVIDRARERLDCTSDEQLAVKIGVASGTIRRIRSGDTPSFITAIKLLDASGVGIPVGVQRIDQIGAAS
ncbi:MAG: helix-turn-helix transcriptional regulator [Gordonia sp. (in: high G+C Gram-positive bacteria)]